MVFVMVSFNRPECTAESEGITDRVMKGQVWKFFWMHLIIALIYGVQEILVAVIGSRKI
jgi:hypothetical protein